MSHSAPAARPAATVAIARPGPIPAPGPVRGFAYDVETGTLREVE
jgi:hypothetical protein